MRVWPMSDLHIELTRGWDLSSGEARPDFDVMVVAGDLLSLMERGVAWLLERAWDNQNFNEKHHRDLTERGRP